MFTFEDKKFYKPCFFLGGGQGRRVYWLFLIVKRDWMRLTLYNFSFSCWKTPTNPPLRYAALEKSVSSLVFVFSIRALDMDLRGTWDIENILYLRPRIFHLVFSHKHEARGHFYRRFYWAERREKKAIVPKNNWQQWLRQVFFSDSVARTKISKLNAKFLGVKYRLKCLRTSMV